MDIVNLGQLQHATGHPDEPDSRAAAERGLPLRPFEEWARDKRSPEWMVAAAKAGNDWPQGRELTEEDFDASLKRVLATEVR